MSQGKNSSMTDMAKLQSLAMFASFILTSGENNSEYFSSLNILFIYKGHEARKYDDIVFWYELQVNQTNGRGLINFWHKFSTNGKWVLTYIGGWG